MNNTELNGSDNENIAEYACKSDQHKLILTNWRWFIPLNKQITSVTLVLWT